MPDKNTAGSFVCFYNPKISKIAKIRPKTDPHQSIKQTPNPAGTIYGLKFRDGHFRNIGPALYVFVCNIPNN